MQSCVHAPLTGWVKRNTLSMCVGGLRMEWNGKERGRMNERISPRVAAIQLTRLGSFNRVNIRCLHWVVMG